MEKQRDALYEAHNQWRGQEEQVDDIGQCKKTVNPQMAHLVLPDR